MGLELKKRSKQYLKNISAIDLPEDRGSRVFGISDFPKYLGEGKNSFRIKPSNLKPNSSIDIEILDSNGNTIYWEIPSYSDADKSRLVSIWVYDTIDVKYNTPDGVSEIIIVGTTITDNRVRWSRKLDVVKNKKSISEIVFNNNPQISLSSSIEVFTNKPQSGSLLSQVSESFELSYKKSIYGDDVTYELNGGYVSASLQAVTPADGDTYFTIVEPSTNASDIYWFTESFEKVYVYNPSGENIFSNYSTTPAEFVPYGEIDYIDLQTDEIYFINDVEFNGGAENQNTWDLQFISETSSFDSNFQSGSILNSEMISGSLELDLTPTTLFPRLGGGQAQPTNTTHSITEVISPTILRVDLPITQSDIRSQNSIHTYEYSDGNVSGTIRYFSTGSDIATQNQIAFANITLTNVTPITGRISSVNTLIKSQGLSNSDFELIANTKVLNESTILYKVPIPTEHLKDPKTLKVQFLNSDGSVSNTEVTIENIIFEGGNVYIGGDQSIITGSFHIGNAIGTGIELAGHSSGYLKSVGYDGFTSASLGKGPGGFLLWSGSGNLIIGEDTYNGVGLDLVANSTSYFRYTTEGSGKLDIRTDTFFIGNPNTQFISGANSNIEISSSFFHLDPDTEKLLITSGGGVMLDTSTGYSDGKNIARHLPIQSIDDLPFIIFLDGETQLVIQAVSQTFNPQNGLSGTLGIEFERFGGDVSYAPEQDSGSFSIPTLPFAPASYSDRRIIRHVVDLSNVGSDGYDLRNNPIFLSVTGSNIVNSQIQVTVHRTVGAGGSTPVGSGLGNVVETTPIT